MAATEASRSSSGSVDSYIGSLISLTSKSEIRYEGVLFNINTEESSIGLRNVRSFGTEGRKKDGTQIPPSDKVYEYILFRGSDIKDLQVKSQSSAQTTPPVHNDPAIIQSHYSQSATASTSLPSSGNGPVLGPTSQSSQIEPPRPAYQSSLPLYQPGGSLGSWGSSPPTTNVGGLAMPPYMQGYYGSSSGPVPQQTPLYPQPVLPMTSSMHQPFQYPSMNTSLVTGSSNMLASRYPGNPLPLLPSSFSGGSLNLQNSQIPTDPSAAASELSTNLAVDKGFTQSSNVSLSSSLPLVSPQIGDLEKNNTHQTTGMPNKIPGTILPPKSVPEQISSAAGKPTSNLVAGHMPYLVTPGQLLQPIPPTILSSQHTDMGQKGVESSLSTPAAPSVAANPAQETAPALEGPPQAAGIQEPLLPLPTPSNYKVNRAPANSHHGYRGGYDRGRGNGRRPPTRFTEDFDFSAMNEKFNKDEVWGHLGKSNGAQEEDYDFQEEDAVDNSNSENKSVYSKDDFFDTLSCDALGGGSRNQRPRFSEQLKRDTETFGEFSRHRGGRGGRGPFRGYSRGPQYGRGYGYYGRGRGYGPSR